MPDSKRSPKNAQNDNRKYVPWSELKDHAHIIVAGDYPGLTFREAIIGDFKGAIPRAFGHYESLGEFRDAQFRYQQAIEQFAKLPAFFRSHFKNDVGLLIAYLNDSSEAPESPNKATKGKGV